MKWLKKLFKKKMVDGTISITLTLKPVKELEKGNLFLWKSGKTGKYEIHTFYSDARYGVKTFTDYNEKDGSSIILNWSGVCGVLSHT
jgi:hypothetical protein